MRRGQNPRRWKSRRAGPRALRYPRPAALTAPPAPSTRYRLADITLRAAESPQELILPLLPGRGEGATPWQSRGEELCLPLATGHLALFRRNACAIRENAAFFARNPIPKCHQNSTSRLSHFLSIIYWLHSDYRLTRVFSSISPEVPSFLTSLCWDNSPPGLERHMGETPRWAHAGIYHCLHVHRVFVVRSYQHGVILGGSINRDAPQAVPR